MLATKKNSTKNAVLVFENGIKIDVSAGGKTGIFFGYLCAIDGIFSISDLQDCGNETIFFTTNNAFIKIDNELNNHIVIIANNFLNQNNNKNITIVQDLTQKNISFLLKKNGIKPSNNIKCALFFSRKLEKMKNNFLKEIDKKISMMPKFYQTNFLEKYQSFKPYLLDHNNLIKKNVKNKSIAVLSFNNNKTQLLNLISIYFDIFMIPYTETYSHIKYLYECKKIDGVIIPHFACNTDFIDNKSKSEIKKLLESNIPVLGIGNGAILIAEIFASKTKIINENVFRINDYTIVDLNNNLFHASNLCYKQITNLSKNMVANYYDSGYKNVVGFSEKHNNLGYTFLFSNNNNDTNFFLKKFYKIMKNARK